MCFSFEDWRVRGRLKLRAMGCRAVPLFVFTIMFIDLMWPSALKARFSTGSTRVSTFLPESFSSLKMDVMPNGLKSKLAELWPVLRIERYLKKRC